MNLQKLFKAQKQLDDHIVKEKGLEGQDLLDKKILAFIAEFGELLNEWRGFKFWSGDKEPRTNIFDDDCEHCINGIDKHSPAFGPYRKCSVCSQNPLLEEYVDCLHFILSIGLELGINGPYVIGNIIGPNVTRQFNFVFQDVSKLDEAISDDHSDVLEIYDELVRGFIGLGEMLGFTWNQIEQAYFAKNEINFERQANGY